jgi:N-acetylmuramoyl-L-alanine amidase
LLTSKHKNGGPETQWEAYTLAQLAACEQVAKALVTRYKLDDIVGHDDIAPTRKNDPGPAFPMASLRQSCGY